MINQIDKRKKKEKIEIAERKVEKAWIRTSKISKKLKKAKKKEENHIKFSLKSKLQNAYKRLKRNKKELNKIEQTK
jgi:capsule polysaccharide export protein KpsE/RkpR